MNNPFENDLSKDIHSPADDLMKHHDANHQLNDLSSFHNHLSAWNQHPHFEYPHHPHTLNADDHSAGDVFPVPPNTFDYLQPDNLPLPDFGIHEHNTHQNSCQTQEQMAGNLHSNLGHGQFHYHEHTACSSKSPEIYTTMSDDGTIYKHTPDSPNGFRFGFVENFNVYSGYPNTKIYLGHGNNDGSICDSHGNYAGWVDSDGHVYNTSGVEVYQTTRGIAGAAAYLLCAYQGGVA